ncbi:membrane protein MLC1 isoform X1 [Anguilla anguilla]|uniref:membrane protein MLC1 isoform X1 n=1 Tax=Anguilla anguilla TaxID=7936 RepID=UPI0015A791D2|nr:membrane protein MLC1 isoform X1 [Anguilla anguilla]
MQREELSAREEFGYDCMPPLERGAGGTGGRRSERDRPERDSYTVDVRASDLQLPQSPALHHCLSCRAWLYSALIGGSLLISAGFSLYLGNVFPDAMDYLRCAAGSSIPAAVVSFAIAKNRHVAVSDLQVVFVSSFAVTTTCLVWFGCKLVLSPSAVNINFNLILLILLEVLLASTVILSARSAEDCCSHGKVSLLNYISSSSSLPRLLPSLRSPLPLLQPVTCEGPVVVTPPTFPARLIKAYSVIEVIVGISAVFGGIIALNMDALAPGPLLSATFFWILVACFPSAIASHVVAEYPNKCLVEMLIAIASVTSPLLFSASGFLSCSVVNFAEIFLHDNPVTKSYDVLLMILTLLLLVQAALTLVTVVHCASYKSQLRLAGLVRAQTTTLQSHHSEQPAANGTLRDFDKDKAWKAVVVQMAQ